MTTREIVVKSGDSVLVVKDDGTWVAYFQEPDDDKPWTEGRLIMSGLHWSLLNDEWRTRLIKRAQKKVRKMIESNGEQT